ncbi:MAG: adenylyltransferase/cytidyltransferase family protein [Chitinispirillaceae bacterium]|nr:adenylyltransferase/cytidyltransferase family protein [Chitinispirillaceae bacterium]
MRSGTPPGTAIFTNAREAAAWLAPQRKAGKTLVTTNGCFDIIHSGHVRYLYEAAGKGDLLVVGVNADATVRKLKGEGRPLRDQADRAFTIAALAMVDATFIFNEEDPRDFIETLKPDVHVKGGDYSRDIIEREAVERNGGTVAIVSYNEGFSTSSIVRKIQSKKTTAGNTM